MPTSFIAGGVSISENRAPSIWQQNTDGWKARVHLPDANGKFPETKHTLMCGAAAHLLRPTTHGLRITLGRKTTHNITKFGVTPSPGRETCDSTKVAFPCQCPEIEAMSTDMRPPNAQLVDHYPHTKATAKEICIDPSTGDVKPWAAKIMGCH